MIIFQPSDQTPQLVIGICDLTVIKMVVIPGVERFGRIVRAMRIVKMKPEEKWAARRLLKPVDRVSNALSRFTVDQAQISVLKSFWRKGIVVRVETASQSPASVKNKCADHGSGGISVLFESLGHGAKLGREWLTGEILHAVF